MKIAAKLTGMVLLLMGLGGCTEPADNPRVKSLMYAVEDRNIAAVNRLISSGANLDERGQVLETPLISACGSGQFRIAEILITHGADIFAHDQFGITAGLFAWRSHVIKESIEGQARERVMAAMKAKGFPFPPPSTAQVLSMVQQGLWPPLPAR